MKVLQASSAWLSVSSPEEGKEEHIYKRYVKSRRLSKANNEHLVWCE
jgi:hypothetical protein